MRTKISITSKKIRLSLVKKERKKLWKVRKLIKILVWVTGSKN